QPLEGETLTVGVQGTDDGHARAGGLERVVVADLAGEKQLGPLRDTVVEEFAACAGAACRARNFAFRRACDEKRTDLEAALDALEQFLPSDSGRERSNPPLTDRFGRRRELHEVERGRFVGMRAAQR